MVRVHIAIAVLIIVEIFFLFSGCHNDGRNPFQPALRPGTNETMTEEVPVVPGQSYLREETNTPALWGLYKVVYDAAQHDISAVPLRGPAYAWNVVKFLQPPAGKIDNMLVEVLDDSTFLETGRIDARVFLHHPFPGDDTYTGFDVCGVFITEGTIVSPWDTDLTYANPRVDPTCLNPDGHTRWMNPSEFLTGDVFGYMPGFWGTSESSENSGFVAGATLNPFKYFAHGLSPDSSLEEWLQDPESVDNRGMFPTGATCARDYEILFPIVGGKIVFVFNYAVLANWIAPDVIPPNDPLQDFPREANAGWPVHVIATDQSRVYYTPEESGGTLAFDIEIFDWDAQYSPHGVPGEVSRFVVWSDDPLVPGGFVEIMSEEVEWNSGFTASTSVASIEIGGAVPAESGESHVWIAVESANPSSYDQGFGAKVPNDRLASYVRVPVDVKNCPKAFVTQMEIQTAGSGDIYNDIEVMGENFTEGEELGLWLEMKEMGGSVGSFDPYKIVASDVRYVNASLLTADFDFTNAPYGEYGIGCINGCGIVTTPEENEEGGNESSVDVVLPTPCNLQLSTGRTGPEPDKINHLDMSWNAVQDAEIYTIYMKTFNVYGYLLWEGEFGSTADTHYEIEIPYLTVGTGGILEVWVTAGSNATGDFMESMESTHGAMYFQSFEESMGNWTLLQENAAAVRLVRSTVDAAYDGQWGVKILGYVMSYPPVWAVLATPPITEMEGTQTVHFEFVHRFKQIAPSNGYQIGWCDQLPGNGQSTVEDYYPIIATAYGYPYNDTACTALQSEFGVTPSTDQNFQSADYDWFGWYLSGFDASVIVGDDLPNYLILGVAGDYYNAMYLCIDEAAVLVY
jgi:hypothetical protein